MTLACSRMSTAVYAGLRNRHTVRHGAGDYVNE